ncbi:MAG: cell division protein FtsA [Armatimonadetes bacterium]|nr:cell division protein FtsA [Armatimonadota bacterium]
MAKGAILVGIDVGTTKICTLIGELQEDRRIDVIGIGTSRSEGMRRGSVIDIDATVHAIEESLEKAQRMAGVEIGSAVVGVTGEHIRSQNSQGVIHVNRPNHEIAEEDVARVLDNAQAVPLSPEQEIVHVIPREFKVDGQDGIKSPVGMFGSRLEVEAHVMAGGTTFLQNIRKCLHRTDLIIEDVVVESLATGEAVLHPDEKELGVAVLDIGGGTADLAVFNKGEIAFSSVIPVAGNHVTYDLAVGLHTTQEDAEKIKIGSGCALPEMIDEDEVVSVSDLGSQEVREYPRAILVEIIKPRMQEIFEMAKNHLDRSEYGHLLPAGVVLSGGGSLLCGATELATQVMGLPARVGIPYSVGGFTDNIGSPAYATGVGLLLYAAKHHYFRRAAQPENLWTLWLRRFQAWFHRLRA